MTAPGPQPAPAVPHPERASGVTSPHGAGAATPGQADQLAVLLDDWRNMLAELEKRRMPSGQVARTALSIERQVHEVHIAQLEGALAAQEPSAADGLLCDNKPVMDALKLALSDPGSITPRAPMESLTSWQRRAVIEHAAPLIIAGQEPHAADGGRSFEDMLADPREQFDPRSELLASISEYAAAPPASAGIKPWHPHGVPQPAPGLAAAERDQAQAGLRETAAGNIRLRDGIAALAARLDASAAATRPSRKSTIEDEIAIALRKLLEDA